MTAAVILIYENGEFYHLRMSRKAFKLARNYTCGPMPNVMATLSTTGVALCPTPQSLADAHY